MSQSAVAVLLRGINVGGNNRLPMSELRAMLADLGVGDVTTLLQSGNAVGRSALPPAELGSRLRRMIDQRLGLQVPVVTIGRDELATVVDVNPMLDQADDPARLMAIVLDKSPTAAQVKAWDPATLDSGRIAVGPRVIYQWCPDGVHRATNLLPLVERHWQITGTGRNWRTTTKLLELLDGLVTR